MNHTREHAPSGRRSMIDLHIHILPCVDDGSFSLEESLRMARMAVECGVTHMAATPHCNLPEEPAPLWAPDFRRKLKAFQGVLDQEQIPLRMYTGMEVFGTPAVPSLLREGKLMPLADSRYLLIEFPFTHYGQEATEILGRVLEMGYRPLVAHPERYRYTQKTPQLLNLWVDMGCLLQINRGSLFGRFGPHAEALAYGLLDRDFVTCVASDAHRSTVRTPWLADAWELLEEEYDPALARRLLHDNPRRILNDQEIQNEEPDWF